jgi:hypothetical protein
VKASVTRLLRRRKRRILRRVNPGPVSVQEHPVLSASNIQYEIADKTRGIAAGGIGAIHLLARKFGLIKEIDDHLHLLKYHLPYHESDHVLNFAYNILAGGTRMEHIEIHRNDEVFLDALGAERIPDPTTAGDFCRRFTEEDVQILMDAINRVRLRVWAEQPHDFFDEAVIDADGTLAPTDAWCKQGVDIAYNGTWGYHPLLVSLANTGEPLFLVNRSGNRPSHEQAAQYLDRAIALCREGGFRKIKLRGDTDFSQTEHLDRWDADGVRFVLGINASPNLKELADKLDETAFSYLERPSPYQVRTVPRTAREDHKTPIIIDREFERLRTMREEVAEFDYKPYACRKSYRIIVLRQLVSREKGQAVLFEEYRYFFFITNDRIKSEAELVLEANQRCNQENVVAQIKTGVHALTNPVDTLVANWAYMVMAALAWSLKAWTALAVPESPRWAKQHRAEKRTLLRMEFAQFRAAVIEMPCQIVRTARRIVYRLLSWTPWQVVFLRLVDHLHCRRLC